MGMPKMSKGWSRICWVVTASWIAAVLGVVYMQYRARNPFDQFVGGQAPQDYLFWHWSGVNLFAPEKEHVRKFEPDFLNIALVMLIPIITLWCIALATHWIRDGFREDAKKK